jgi:hypothetical protein
MVLRRYLLKPLCHHHHRRQPPCHQWRYRRQATANEGQQGQQ